jgi:hypothetical protein
VATAFPGVFAARSVTTPSGTFGHIRIFTFSVDDPTAFVKEFIRLVELLPADGLIIDVRGNGGGHIWASEGLLQTLTPLEVAPEPVQFINTQLNLRICRRHETNPSGIDLGPWVESMRRAIETGAAYSRSFSITPEDFANQFGQRYHGPVVLITDARCYSATDIFTAGFKDHEIGTILGVDDNTGAGGANVWTHNLLRQLMQLPNPDPDTPYKTLPGGANMRVSIRRTLRVGERAGTPVEDLGIKPDQRYFLTKKDLLNSNVDLMKRAGQILAAATPVRELSTSVTRSGTQLNISATVRGLNRLDSYVDGRPLDTRTVSTGPASYSLTIPTSAALLQIAGYHNGNYVAARKIPI